MMIRALVLLICVGALGLAACGNRGALERPAPLWGNPSEVPAESSADDELADEDDRSRLPGLPGDDPFEDEQ